MASSPAARIRQCLPLLLLYLTVGEPAVTSLARKPTSRHTSQEKDTSTEMIIPEEESTATQLTDNYSRIETPVPSVSLTSDSRTNTTKRKYSYLATYTPSISHQRINKHDVKYNSLKPTVDEISGLNQETEIPGRLFTLNPVVYNTSKFKESLPIGEAFRLRRHPKTSSEPHQSTSDKIITTETPIITSPGNEETIPSANYENLPTFSSEYSSSFSSVEFSDKEMYVNVTLDPDDERFDRGSESVLSSAVTEDSLSNSVHLTSKCELGACDSTIASFTVQPTCGAACDNDTDALGGVTTSASTEMPWPIKMSAELPGDLILGGLMMVHEREEEVTCGPVMPQGGVQALEAMLYTLDTLNAPPLIPNVTLGAHILDDCDKDTYGLEMAVDFIKGMIIHRPLL